MKSWFPTFQSLAKWRIPLPTWWPPVTSPVERQSLLRLIAVATEEKIPLTPLLLAWSEDSRGVQQRRLRRLVKLLESGRTLPDAVEQVPGLLSDEAILALRFDSQTGTRTKAVRELLESWQQAPASATSRLRRAAVYCAGVLPMGLFLVVFIRLKIAPKFEKILHEFAVPQPESMRTFTAVTNTLAYWWWLALLIVLAGLYLVFSTRGGKFLRRTIAGRWLRPLRQWHAADVLQMLAVAVGAGRPIPGSLSTLARYHFDPTIRNQLLFVRNEVEQGADAWESMAAADLLNQPEVRLLKSAERVGNQPWVLQKLAAAKRSRISKHSDLAAELLLPAIILLLGAFVLWQALAVFEPLENLNGWLV